MSTSSIASTTEGAGAFNKRVMIQQAVEVSDGQGGTTPTWSTVVTTWAHIKPFSGSETFRAQQVYPNKMIRVMIRYRPSTNITALMRVQYKSQLYNIRKVSVPEEAQTVIELLCEELQARGSM